MRRARTLNASHYKWHIHGTLAGVHINRKYLSMREFLEEYGGDKSPLNLNRHKVARLRTTMQKNPMWKLVVLPIKEKRNRQTVYFD